MSTENIEDEACRVARITEVMRESRLPQRLIDRFIQQYLRFCRGDSGKLRWQDTAPPKPTDIVDAGEARKPHFARHGEALLSRTVCIKLNGGLGTSMALERAKSLIHVRQGHSFLSLVAQQMTRLHQKYDARTPLVLMNSFRTREDSLRELGDYRQPVDVPLDFLQHRVPRIERESLSPLTSGEPTHRWAPPGHGDIYLALSLSGVLERLLSQGFVWAFVSNVDNLGATLDAGLLGFVDRRGLEFAMEVTPKSAADVKGGTLVRHNGRLTLLERAQVEDGHESEFENTDVLPVFNTNSLWWRLDALHERIGDDRLELPLIVNPKRVAGKDIVQLETAMGAAIGCFDKTVGLNVSRQRFAPVKTSADLLAVRSDAYELDEESGALRLSRQRDEAWGPPVVRLDSRYFRSLADLEHRVPISLGLNQCRSLVIEGDIRFAGTASFSGHVQLSNLDANQKSVAKGAHYSTGEYSL